MDIRPIKTEADYQAALKKIESLFGVAPGTLEGDQLEVLATLVEAYEERHWHVNAPDPIEAIARKYFHLPCSVMTPNRRRFETLRSLAATYRPQCVIELVWQACLTYDIESSRVRRLIEGELRLPYLKITTDYSPSDSARISARVEALLETARARLVAGT